jgi:hypothetical protein
VEGGEFLDDRTVAPPARPQPITGGRVALLDSLDPLGQLFEFYTIDCIRGVLLDGPSRFGMVGRWSITGEIVDPLLEPAHQGLGLYDSVGKASEFGSVLLRVIHWSHLRRLGAGSCRRGRSASGPSARTEDG